VGWRREEDGTGPGREDLTGEISRMPRLELLPRDRVTGSVCILFTEVIVFIIYSML
jgi:hypothetical protein